MSEWKEYIGSDEQIDDMCNAVDGYILRLSDGTMTELSIGGPYRDDATDTYRGLTITHYLICNPHPRAEMICQQARTGQPVHIKVRNGTGNHLLDISTGFYYFDLEHSVFITTTPDWNIPNAEYSFTEFKEEI